jgi:hypothetical protein
VVEIDLEYHRERACTSKRAFDTKAEAKAEAKVVSKRKGIKLRVYECPFCGRYHHTSRCLSDIEAIQRDFYHHWQGAQ